jgi:hypothetical protein
MILSKEEFKKLIYRWTLVNTKGKIKLRHYQLDPLYYIYNSVVNKTGEEIAWIIPRQCGKTTGLSSLIHFMSIYIPSAMKTFEDGLKIGLFGPSQEQVNRILYDLKQNFNTDYSKKMLGITSEISNGENFILSNGSEIRARTCSITSIIEGWTCNMAIIEEAQDVPDLRILKTIYPMTATTGGSKIMVGTPTPEKEGYFHDFVTLAGKKELIFRIEPSEVFPYSKEWQNEFEATKRRIGEKHPIFQTQYMGNWIDITAKFITAPNLLKHSDGPMIPKESEQECYVGIDIGKHIDSTVATVIRKDGRLLNWLELNEYPYPQQATEIENFLSPYNVKKGIIDAFQGGEAVADILAEHNYEMIEPIKMNDIIKSEMYLAWESGLFQGKFKYPNADMDERIRFETQTIALQKDYKKCLLMVSKPKKKPSFDDYPDSAVRAWYALSTDEELDFDPIGSG